MALVERIRNGLFKKMVLARHWTEIQNIRLRITAEERWRGSDGAFIAAFVGATRRAGTTTIATGVARSFHEAAPERKVLLLGLATEGRRVTDFVRLAKTRKPGRPVKRPSSDDGAAEEADSGPSAGGDIAIPTLLSRAASSKVGFDVLAVGDSAELRCIFDSNDPFWSEARKAYQYILVDGGAVGSEPHILISGEADLLSLVVDGRMISRNELSRMREKLEAASLLPDGVILNRRRDYLPRAFRAAVE